MSAFRTQLTSAGLPLAILAAFFIVSLQGCAPAPPILSGVKLPRQTVEQLRPGNTTKAEVLDWFGMPLSIAKKGETLTISRESAWLTGGVADRGIHTIRTFSFYQVDADTFFEMFSTKRKITDHHRIYYYYDSVSIQFMVTAIVYQHEHAHTYKDQLWLLLDEETGIVEDYVFRKGL